VGVAVTQPRGRRADHLTHMRHLYWQARQRTGLGPSVNLGEPAGSQRGRVASRADHSTTRYMAFHETAERRLRQPFRGWPSVSGWRNWQTRGLSVWGRQRPRLPRFAGSSPAPDTNTNPWSGQSDHRNALSPAKQVSPGLRAAIRCCISALRPGHKASGSAGKRERQAGYQTKQHSGLVAGRAVGPAGAGDAPGNGRALS
jgi:hypothetical protein